MKKRGKGEIILDIIRNLLIDGTEKRCGTIAREIGKGNDADDVKNHCENGIKAGLLKKRQVGTYTYYALDYKKIREILGSGITGRFEEDYKGVENNPYLAEESESIKEAFKLLKRLLKE